MARINRDLIKRLESKLGVGASAVYTRIQKIVNETALERPLAALLLAMRNNINVNKYSTPAERAEIRQAQHLRAGGWEAEKEAEVVERPARRPAAPAKRTTKRRRTKGKTIFVVHGRDDALRKSMFEFLRALKLDPLEWDEALRRAKGANPYVGDVIDQVMNQAQAVLVMFSPDDLVQLKEQFLGREDRSTEGRPQGQARPNVIFEAGLAIGRHQDKTLFVEVGRVKPFSDIAGRHMLRLNDSPESRNELANRLEKLHCDLDKGGRDWLKVGTFKPTEAKPAKKTKRQ